ncbi:hypothetical protein D8674_019726 [Pyrus ussuriensis x Pyrus communis]|uniref:Uncharacterized protein n=1 Tax=Pyrus ussuriensis x Pyrus communis TaxID=2448454 RepID=A0A5N5GLN8_9ROSA|nr:hypothetical protein D8674_019726 [Pyrus ussuriensis x Pyrus communis]
MVSSRKSARSHALKGKPPIITPSDYSPCTCSPSNFYLEQCIHRIPNHMLVPLIPLSSSDDKSGFGPDCVTPPSCIPCSPIMEHTPLPSPTPKDDPEVDPEEDPEEDLYWVSDEDSLPKHD